jgi:uncharacterized protein with PQ loop repeat
MQSVIETWSTKAKRSLAFVLCVLTILFAGLTVWSINGSITTITRWYDQYGDSGDNISTWTPSPVLQGILASVTIALLFASIWLLFTLQTDKLKPS